MPALVGSSQRGVAAIRIVIATSNTIITTISSSLVLFSAVLNETRPCRTLARLREFTKGCLVKGGLAIRHVFNLHIKNGT